MNSKPMAILCKTPKIQLLVSKRIKEKMEELLNMLVANKTTADENYSKFIPMLQETLLKTKQQLG